MARVDITLGGRHYPIACDDGQEDRVRRIAAYIDKKITTMGTLAGATDTHVLVMASLMLGDELFDAHSRLETAPAETGGAPEAGIQEEESVAASISQLASRLESIAARLEGA